MKRLIGIILISILLISNVTAFQHECINTATFAVKRADADRTWGDINTDSPEPRGVVETHVDDTPPALTVSPTPAPITTFIPIKTAKPTVSPTATPTPKPTKTPAPIVPIPTQTIPANTVILNLADYGIKADGTDETGKLQDALEYARDHNIGTIVFPKNKIIVISSMIRFYDKMTIIGNGCTLKRKSGMGSHAGQMITVNAGGKVSGLIYDGNSEFVQAAGDGVFLNSNVIFDNNEVKNVREYSVVVYGGSNIQITNNRIHDGYQYGIATGGGVGGVSHNITVTGNTIYNCQQVGIKIRGTHGAVIKNNNIQMDEFDQFARGISLYSFDLPNDDILIDGNTVTGSFEGGNMDGISSDNNQNTNIRITNNIVSKCDVGIDLHFSKGIVSGNKISECSSSITGTSGNIVTGNIIL